LVLKSAAVFSLVIGIPFMSVHVGHGPGVRRPVALQHALYASTAGDRQGLLLRCNKKFKGNLGCFLNRT
jgi:hypothetical protein